MFGIADAALEALQFLSLTVAPGGVSNLGALNYSATMGQLEPDFSGCAPDCVYSSTSIQGLGDDAEFTVTGKHGMADRARLTRSRRQRRPAIRLLRRLSAFGDWATRSLETMANDRLTVEP